MNVKIYSILDPEFPSKITWMVIESRLKETSGGVLT